MARSGTTNFTVSATSVINRALALVSERSAEVPFQDEEVNDALSTLNMMVKAWMADGLHLWTREEGVLFLRTGVSKYNLGGSSGDHATTEDDFVDTTITAAAVTGANTITVASTANMTASDNIGIELDDGTRQWTTIVSVDSSTGLTLTDTLTDDVAIGRTVFTYTTVIEKPVRVETSRRRLMSDNSDIEMNEWARQQYMAQPDKTSQGTPTNFYFSPEYTFGVMYVWQTASSVNQVVKFTFQRTIQNFDTVSDNPDFPQEWALALVYNLAALIGHEYDCPLQKLGMIKQEAMMLKDQVLGFDTEKVEMKMEPDFS